jgi:phospholipid/cholesterol/gamma-HCH transport system substrate-binding protein
MADAHSSTAETLMGAAVIAVAVAFGAYAWKTSGVAEGSGAGGVRISAEFDNVEGINVGSDVRLAGVKVGTVVGQSLNPDNLQAHLDMMIDAKVPLSDDSSAKITAEGLLGSKFVALEPGGSEVKLGNGGVISYTQGAVDVWSLISQSMFGNKPPKPEGAAPAPAPDAAPPSASPDTPPAQ